MEIVARLRKIRIKNRWVQIVLIELIIIIIYHLMYFLGGSHTTLSILNIIPIALAAYFWKVIGALVVAILCGILAGPMMPQVVELGYTQEACYCVVRTVMYSLIGTGFAIMFSRYRKMTRLVQDKAVRNSFTGLYNERKLEPLLESLIEQRQEFNLIIANLNNLDGINHYVSETLVKKVIDYFLARVTATFKGSTVYYLKSNTYAFIVKKDGPEAIKEKLHHLVSSSFSSFCIDDFHLALELKFGIVAYQGCDIEVAKLLKKALIALDMGINESSGIYFYTPEHEQETIQAYEIAGSLKQALKNDDFYLVYQPIVDLKTNEITSAEVLLRWDRKEKTPVGPAVFIAIAEKIGLITEISKWVIVHNLVNVRKMQSQGIDIITSVNLTGDEIMDESFIKWAKALIEINNINRSKIAIEITERVLARDEAGMSEMMAMLKEKGYLICIDDFGTGYNSLMTVGKFPMDIIKIDKYFIDRFDQPKIQVLIEHLITASHRISNQVVAEGVETQEQVDFLRRLGCDKIQGYYYSKPLKQEDFVKYYHEFNERNKQGKHIKEESNE